MIGIVRFRTFQAEIRRALQQRNGIGAVWTCIGAAEDNFGI
jgi:hypothetical protein